MDLQMIKRVNCPLPSQSGSEISFGLSFKLFTINIKESTGLLESGRAFGKFVSFGNQGGFWKLMGILET
jgi:hypothetical protein